MEKQDAEICTNFAEYKCWMASVFVSLDYNQNGT